MLNEEQQRHSMILQTTHESGADEWFCPICGRRFLLQMVPKFKKIVLEAGDEYAYHSAAKGNLDAAFATSEMDSNSFLAQDDLEPLDERYLAPWKEWMDKVDFD
jgi:hypothetical protein